MRNNILAILFFSGLAVCKGSSISYKVNNEVENIAEKKPEIKDDWIAIDKVQHFSYSLLISLGCQYVLVNKMNNTEKSSLPISSAFSFSAGLLKELNDQKGKNGYFSLKDMVANFGGIIFAAIVINQ
mgnify:FL=1